jgi:hypothetical protein
MIFSTERSAAGTFRRAEKTRRETRKESPMAAQAMKPTAPLEIRLPKKRLMANPMAGNNGIRPT